MTTTLKKPPPRPKKRASSVPLDVGDETPQPAPQPQPPAPPTQVEEPSLDPFDLLFGLD